ncbi:MAG: alpha/beta hydrolase [Oscillospiraceae bacterium]|nr:alpha/beta hydrolase [Oscillospiraceae bacterium]
MNTVIIILMIIIILALLVLIAGYVAFTVACWRGTGKIMGSGAPSLAPYLDRMDEGRQWFLSRQPERVEIVSYDGLRLRGLYLHNPEAKGTIILMHGYRMDGYTDFTCVYKKYYDAGFSLLNAFQRAHAESEGDYITYGIKERFDCRDWAEYVADRFGPEHKIVLDGLSMGATTVLMAASLELPENVRGIIADCGFTSPWDQLEHLMRTKYHLPVHPLLDAADLCARLLGKFSLKGYSTIEAMAKNRLPVLFLHGEADEFVPTVFSIRAFEACAGPKRLVTIPGAAHGVSYLVDTERCDRELDEFLSRV